MVDVHFRNGKVFDGQRCREGVSVLLRDGRVHAIDTPDIVDPMVGEDAERVEIGEGLLMPGFFDSHMHPMLGGLERRRCDIYHLTTAEECL